jgi:hypothetical protein
MLSPHERARLRAETLCDDATIRRWDRGDRVHDATDVRLTRAARLLGISVPKRRSPTRAKGEGGHDAA